MRTYELHASPGFNALRLTDRPPVAALGEHDVRVRVRAVALNHRDLRVARSSMERGTVVVPTSDGVGEVVEVGSAVTAHAPGDRVAAAFFPTWLDGELTEAHHGAALGETLDGMLTEEVVLPESAWVRVPDHLTDEQAATLPCAAVTAWHAVVVAGGLTPGDTVLVQGTGGVSIFALQLAHAAGARVVATSSSAAKRARVEELGAAVTLDYVATPDWGDAVRDLTDGRGVDIAVEVGGVGTFDQSARAVRYGGTISVLGALTGRQGPIDLRTVFAKGLHVQGVYVGSVRMFRDLVRFLEVARIEPVVDAVFTFEEARAAYEHLASGRHFGKVVIRVS